MYIKHCKLSTKKQLRLIEYFVAGTPARTAADLVGVHRNSAIRFFHKLREKIALKQQDRSEQFCGKIELEESYFCGIRKGKRGRGAPGKVPVFGILKRGGQVYTQVIDNTKSATLMPIIRERIKPDTLSIRIVIDLIMPYMCLNLNIIALIILNFSFINIIILTESKTSGIKQKGTSESIMAFQNSFPSFLERMRMAV